MFMPGYNRSNAMLPKRLQYAGIHQKITESISTGPYINHIKIMRIKRRLKAAEYVISPAKIALFMLDDTRQII
jgi:anti-sigma28 factor (negative regulator of flagellin synthesis)